MLGAISNIEPSAQLTRYFSFDQWGSIFYPVDALIVSLWGRAGGRLQDV